jgi:Ca2+-transporting ATPase
VPLLPIQILWINLVTDGLPGLALASEPAEPDIMRRPPRPPKEGLFAQGLLFQVIWVGMLIGAIALMTQAFGVNTERDSWQTLVFTVLTLSQMWQIMAIRSDHFSLFQQGILSNTPLLGAVLLTTALQLAVVYIPPLNPIFHTVPLTPAELIGCVAVSSIVFVAIELSKWVIRRRARHRDLLLPQRHAACARRRSN